MPSMILPQTQPFPQVMLTAVADYKKLAADYASVEDATVKASYKIVLDKKLADLQVMLSTYNSTALAALQALQVA